MRSILAFTLLALGCGTGAKQAAEHPPPAGVDDAGSSSGAAPVVLASGQATISTLAIDKDNLYWVNSGRTGGVYKLPKAGGAVTSLHDGTMTNIGSFGLDDTSLYVPVDHAIVAIRKTGGSITTLVSTIDAAATTIVQEKVYWPDKAQMTVSRVSVMGGTLETITPQLPVVAFAAFMAADSDAVYTGIPSGGILKSPVVGGTTTQLDAQTPSGLALDATAVYYTNSDAVRAIQKDGTSRMLTSATNALGIAVDDSYLYFAERGTSGTGRILKIEKSGGGMAALAEGLPGPRSVVVDDSDVYFSCIDDGTIRRVSKTAR